MIKNIKDYIMPTYGERKLEFKEGSGCYLISTDNKKYLDFGGGIAVNSLGHCHPKLVNALQEQASKLWHTSNLYHSSLQEKYAEQLCKNTFADKVFFTNSGVEAIEAGIKVVRSFHSYHKNFHKKNIITFEGAFHGRTFAALSAQQNKKYFEGFEPLMPGFLKVPFNDLINFKKNIDENIGAVLLEPIQGEGGIRPFDLKFIEEVRKICDKNNILFFLDEVQSGFGRSGKLFSYEWTKIEPDILASAKGIASGFPFGACLSTEKACIGMTKGKHGSTYGGNPLAISVATEVIEIISNKNFLNSVDKNARYFWRKLKNIEKKFDEIIEVRGAGLLLGIKVKSDNIIISNLLTENGLLNVPANDSVIRLAPPLIITESEIDEALKIIEKVFGKINE